MKRVRFTIVVLLSIFLLSVAGCGGEVSKPKVGYLPQGWFLEEEWPYEESCPLEPFPADCIKRGMLLYRTSTNESVFIIYTGDTEGFPDNVKSSAEALASYICEGIGEPEEIGTVTLDGQSAGYTKWSSPSHQIHGMCIACLKGNVLLQVIAKWSDAGDEEEVMSLIESITF